MSVSKHYVSIGFGVVGIAIAYFFPYDRLPKEKAEIQVMPVAAVTAAPVAVKAVPPPDPIVSAAIQQKRREESNFAVYNRLKEIHTVAEGSQLKINIRTRTEAKSCQSGDFDLIKSLVTNVDEKVFLLSVEKLRGRFEKPSAVRLSLFDIMKGDPHAFAMPKLDAVQEYGVYLCIDAEKTNSCNQKPALNVRDWNRVINRPKSPSNIVYFQLLTTRSSRTYLVPIEKWGASAIGAMKDNLKGWLNKPDETLELSAALMSNLGSLPGNVREGELLIPLPYRDPKCDTKASIQPPPNRAGG